MTQSMRMWGEISFNLAYLLTLWGLVIAMNLRQDQLLPTARQMTRLFIWAFALLALGDPGHLGFRVLAYLLGNLEATFTVFGIRFGLVGLGALLTALTLTFFYVAMLALWHQRFQKPYGWFGTLLLTAVAVRLALMLFPQNQWNNAIPPQPWSTIRNLPLMVVGLGVVYLIFRDAIATSDRTFKWIGVMLLVSQAFYVPVILFVQIVPLIGLLMIAKTLAYLAIAWLGFLNFFQLPTPPDQAT